MVTSHNMQPGWVNFDMKELHIPKLFIRYFEQQESIHINFSLALHCLLLNFHEKVACGKSYITLLFQYIPLRIQAAVKQFHFRSRDLI